MTSKGPSGPRRVRLVAAVGAALLGLLGFGCSGDRGGYEFDFAERLPQATVIREQTYLDVGTQTAQSALVRGWNMPEKKGEIDFVWAVEKTAIVDSLITNPELDRLSFACWPFTWPGAPAQTVAVSVNGRHVSQLELTPGYHSYTLELPPGTLRPGQNRLVFGFAYTQFPYKYDKSSTDVRTLAVAFDYIAIGEAGEKTDVPRPPQRVGRHLQQAAGSEVVYQLLVPARAELEFSLAYPRPIGLSHLPTTEVLVRDRDGSESRLYSSRRRDSGDTRVRLDLSGRAGKLVDLVFRVRSNPESPGQVVVWETPRLTGTPGFDTRSNVILIVIDTLRQDHLGCYGGDVLTPNIDSLAERGVVFDAAYSHSPMTGPAHSSMFTSLYPAQHLVLTNAESLDAKYHTLAEIMRAMNRDTAGFVSLGVLGRRWGFGQGFDTYEDKFPDVYWKTAHQVNEELLPWLKKRGGRPFFLWAHYSDPHEPYTAPDAVFPEAEASLNGDSLPGFSLDARRISLLLALRPGENRLRLAAVGGISLRDIRVSDDGVDIGYSDDWEVVRWHGRVHMATAKGPATLMLTSEHDRDRNVKLEFLAHEPLTKKLVRRRYAEEVAFVDREIGRLLEALKKQGLLENTLIILTSDHGEGLGDHGLLGHVNQLYNSLIRVPLIISFPGRIPAGQRIPDPVAHADLLPTILNLLGADAAGPIEGLSLASLMKGEGTLPQRTILAETHKPEAPSDMRALIEGNLKFIRNDTRSRDELYNMAQDPHELTDLVSADSAVTARLKEVLENAFAKLRSGGNGSREQQKLSKDDLEKLRSLGYLR